MASTLRRLGIAFCCVAVLAPTSVPAQAPRQIRLPQPAHLQPINVWQQYNLQQAILQQNALQQNALQQMQLQNALLYPGLGFSPNALAYPALGLQPQNALLYSVQQLQQENAMLYGMLQQQAALQQLQQQGVGGGQPAPGLPLLPR